MADLLGALRRVARLALVSMALAAPVAAHEVQPAVADAVVTADRVVITIRAALEPMLAGIDLGAVADTNNSPLSGRADALRALPPEDLAAAVAAAWPDLATRMTLLAGGATLTPELLSVDVPPVGDVALRRDSVLTLGAHLPPDGTAVTFGWDADLGGLIVRQTGEGETYEAFLSGGTLTEPMPRAGVARAGAGQAFLRNVVVGFEHIVPAGLDHILFVLGLFLYSLAWRPLLWQVTAFTLAHTVTLALATLGVIAIPPASMWVIETIIAASIVYVALENVLGGRRTTIGWGRIGVVFAFGLLHGLGFASVFAEAGMAPATLLASLVAFNVGVEIGQLAVIAAAFLLVGAWFGRKAWYRRVVVVPGSLLIAAIGAYWVLNRIGLAGDLPLLT